MSRLGFFVAFVFILDSILAKDLPSYFPKCRYPKSKNEVKQFEKCFQNSGNKMNTVMKRGIPELGIPSLDNIVVPQVTLQQKMRAAMFTVIISNLTAENLWNYKFSNFSFDYETNTYNSELNYDWLRMKGDYAIDGNILNQALKFQSKFDAKFANCKIYANIPTTIEKRANGKEYLKIADLTVSMDLGKVNADIGNLFGDETLNKAIAVFLEESVGSITQMMEKDIKEIVNGLVDKISASITDLVPFKSIFLS